MRGHGVRAKVAAKRFPSRELFLSTPFMRPVLPVLLALSLLAGPVRALELPKTLNTLFDEHCLECHDAQTKKGGLDLEKLGTQFGEPSQFSEWVKIHDRMRAGEMPPKKKARPPLAELNEVTG